MVQHSKDLRSPQYGQDPLLVFSMHRACFEFALLHNVGKELNFLPKGSIESLLFGKLILPKLHQQVLRANRGVLPLVQRSSKLVSFLQPSQ